MPRMEPAVQLIKPPWPPIPATSPAIEPAPEPAVNGRHVPPTLAAKVACAGHADGAGRGHGGSRSELHSGAGGDRRAAAVRIAAGERQNAGAGYLVRLKVPTPF